MDRHLEKLQREIDSAVAGLSPEQLAWHPEGKWCAAEILEHMFLTYTGTTKGFGRVMEAGKSLARKTMLRDRARAMVVVRFGYVPGGREAPPTTRPRGTAAAIVVSEIPLKLAEMDEAIRRCGERFGARMKVLDHPFLGPLSVEQWRKFHLVHGMHHVKQIHRLRQAMALK